MTLPRKLIATFTPLLRVRGEEYVRNGRVTIVSSTPSLAEGRVHGTNWHDVHIRVVAGGALDMRCSCSYARDHGNCKHIWAVLVACDRAGVLPSKPDEAFLAESRLLREAEEAIARERRAREEALRAEEQRVRTEALLAMQHAATILAPMTQTADPRPWVQQIRAIKTLMTPGLDDRPAPGVLPEGRRLIYTVDVARSAQRTGGAIVEVGMQARRGKSDGWGPVRPIRLTREQWLAVPSEIDREIAQLLLGSSSAEFGTEAGLRAPQRFVVSADAATITLKRMCETTRCRVQLFPTARESHPLTWDGDEPWALHLAVTADPTHEEHYALNGWLARGEERMTLDEPALLTADGIVIAHGRVGRLVDHGAQFLTTALAGGSLRGIPHDEAMDLLGELYALPKLPAIELPSELDVKTVSLAPVPRLLVRRVVATPWSPPGLEVTLAFGYGDAAATWDNHAAGIVQFPSRTVTLRDRAAETIAMQRLERAGFKTDTDYGQRRSVWRIAEGRGMAAVVDLVHEGWSIEFEGQDVRTAGPLSMHVSSGIDWFDVDATVTFGKASARLPELLAALRRGDRTVRLSDDSVGVLDDAWMDRTGLLAATGTLVDGKLRFSANQLGILDVLLSALPEPDVDAAFAHARAQLTDFAGVHAAEPPPSFQGTLRDYQKEGLGWLHFLRRFGFGGCLADDMGLGKTVQMLALLAARQVEQAGPSLVVVPRSLVFNWQQEAARFTPTLRVLVHQGPERHRDTSQLGEYDVVLTTYGTLRRDAIMLRETEFDYLVVDEAQAIKNAATASAKAVRLVRARHRVAMSGTPIENSLRELWSLLDFLNPGMLGKASVFTAHLRQLEALDGPSAAPMPLPDVDMGESRPAQANDDGTVDGEPVDGETGDGEPVDGEPVDGETGDDGAIPAPMSNADRAAQREASQALLSRAVRPYILRRTKAQVTPELPERLEQTVLVDLTPKERARYDELRDHYRNSLLRQIGPDGIGKQTMHVLEALLRLRQAACHPGLIDPARRDESSSKLDLLLLRVTEAVAERHKVLVFSQFTTLLSLVRDRFDAAGIAYAYLDGDTKDRQRVVTRFQEDPECGVFLISLKAGGVGLNLTAAEYVYLLDPWWNPAVEAQAIDRAHRIGQTRRVFASRLIARDTVEEKVLALQDRKRNLADAIIRADASLLSTLGREELEMLLS